MEVLIAGTRALGLELTPEQVERYRRYLASLTAWNSRINLTSEAALADAERVHFLDSLTLVPEIQRAAPADGSLVDIGTGAGFPGLALKIALPELRTVLVESVGKKAEFLRAVSNELGLLDVQVVAERAEVAAHRPELRHSFSFAVTRALGPLPVVLELTLPFCRTGGMVIAPRGAGAEAEAERCEGVAEALGGRLREVRAVHLGDFPEQRWLVIVDKIEDTGLRFPRRPGIPAKRPLSAG